MVGDILFPQHLGGQESKEDEKETRNLKPKRVKRSPERDCDRFAAEKNRPQELVLLLYIFQD